MAYTRKVGADHPGLFVFVLDRSGSMNTDWPGNTTGTPIVKAEFLAEILNKVLREMGALSVKQGGISHRCDLALIGYEGSKAFSLWEGGLKGRDVVGIPDVVDNPLGEFTRTEQKPDGLGGFNEVEKRYKYWIEAAAGGNTPMAAALRKARELVEVWLEDPKHRDSFPPVVIHITDGMPTDDKKQALAEAQKIKDLETTDGKALLITIHVPDGYPSPILFPLDESHLPPADESAKFLFEMASVLPNEMYESAVGAGLPVKPGCRLMIMNADAYAVAKLVNWGSSAGGAREDFRPAAPAAAGVDA